MAKEKILAQVATLLDKFSERLVRVARETRQNTDAVATLTDKVRLEVGAQQERLAALADDIVKKVGKSDVLFLAGVVEEMSKKLEAFKKESDVRETQQTARDQNNVQSLVNLRSSTQKAFDQVRDDVAGLLKQIQRLNERVGQVESRLGILELGPAAWHQMVGVEKRVTEIESEIALIVAVRQANEAFMRGPASSRVNNNLSAVADLCQGRDCK